MAIVLTESEKDLAQQLDIPERDALKAKELGEAERVREIIARAAKKATVELTPMEIELGKALGVSEIDLLRAKAIEAGVAAE